MIQLGKIFEMAEAAIAAFGAAIGVAVALAIVCFALRQGRPHGPEAAVKS